MVRVGGGYLNIAEFINQYHYLEMNKKDRNNSKESFARSYNTYAESVVSPNNNPRVLKKSRTLSRIKAQSRNIDHQNRSMSRLNQTMQAPFIGNFSMKKGKGRISVANFQRSYVD